jgi:molybdopterin converting factor subunit 1
VVAAEFTVLFFASLADRAGVRRLTMALEPGDTIATVRERLGARFPAITPILPRVLFALDEEYADAATAVTAGATLALIPPVSGG